MTTDHTEHTLPESPVDTQRIVDSAESLRVNEVGKNQRVVEAVYEEQQPQLRYKRPYRLSHGRQFLCEGAVGEKYMIPDCNCVVEIKDIGPGSISVYFPATGVTYGISRNTEVISFNPVKHAELLKRIPKVKADKDQNEE